MNLEIIANYISEISWSEEETKLANEIKNIASSKLETEIRKEYINKAINYFEEILETDEEREMLIFLLNEKESLTL